MNNKGFISIVTVIVIAVLAVGFAGVAVYYETQKDEMNTNTNTIFTNTNITNANSNTSVSNTNSVVNTNTIVDETDGWQTYESKKYFTTDNWEGFQVHDANTSTFLLQFPSSWTLGTSVFYDENMQKIAEFSPGVVNIGETGDCSDEPAPTIYGEPTEVLESESVTIGQFDGKKTVWYTITEGDTGSSWYPNRYCLQNGSKIFIMNFYERELGQGDRQLFENILSTLKFIN